MKGLHIGDSILLSEQLEDSSIDLTITSPPYADTLSYGKQVTTYDEGDFAEWFLPLAHQLYRATKDTGSFIVNINDRVIDGSRSIYVVEWLEKRIGFYTTDIYGLRSQGYLPDDLILHILG